MKHFLFHIKMVAFWSVFFISANEAFADIWRIMPGQANDIAIGANGQIWAIGNTPAGGGFNILKWNGTAWEGIDGGGMRIAVDPKGVPWVVNNTGQIWQRAGNRWVAVAGTANDIGIGANGQVWIITRTPASGGFTIQYLQTILAPGGFETLSWRTIDGGGTRISVGPNGQPWVVNSSGQISERKNGRWELKTGSANDIGVGANGVVWAVGRNPVAGSFGIHRWDGVSRWDAVDGGGTQIAVDHFGRPLIVNHLKEIYRRDYSLNVLSATPSITPLSMNYPAGGRIGAICVDPTNANHVIAAGESGGLFETTSARSASRTWRHLTTFGEFSVTDILILPVSGGHEVYVTCDNTFENTYIPLIWKRDTRGNWSRVAFTPGTYIDRVSTSTNRLVKSKTNNTLYAAGRFGVAEKPEGTDTWRINSVLPGSGVTALETMADGTLIAGVVSGLANGVYYSPDNGSRWFPAACPVPLPNFSSPGVQRFSLKADAGGQIVLISKYTGTGVQLFGSLDNGRNWAAIQNQWGTTRVSGNAVGGYESVLPTFNTSRNRLEIYVSNAENVYYGFSNGATIQAALTNALNNAAFPWQPGPGFAGGVGFNAGHEDTRQILFLEGTPRKMLITSDGGISVQDITGDSPETFTWTLENASFGLNALQVYNVTGNGRELYFGTQDNAYGYNSSGDGRVWSSGGGREGFFLSNQGVGYDNPWTLYGLGGSFGKMTGNFSAVTECGPASTPDRWNSPTTGQGRPVWFGSNIYIQDDGPATGTGFKWKITYNNGCNWEGLPNSTYARKDLNTFFSSSANSPFNLYVPLSNGSAIVLGRLSNPLNRDATNIWQYPLMAGLEGGIAEMGSQFLFNPVMAVNPSNPQHLLACEANTGILKVSQTGGGNWTEVANFTNVYTESGRYSLKSTQNTIAIWSMEFSPFDPQIVLLGTTTRGLFLSRDGGATWARLNFDGIFMPTDFYWKSPREVIVSTYGRGLFRGSF